MYRKLRPLVAKWFARRLERRARQLRRALRDHERAELRRIQAADRRARGLRLFAAWCSNVTPVASRTIVSLEPASSFEQKTGRRAA
jgi:hypothetical protein